MGLIKVGLRHGLTSRRKILSKISFKPADTGTATFTIEAPATNTNRTITLPDEAGTILSNVSDISGSNVTGQLASSNMPAGSVIQVVSNETTTPVNSNSNSYIDTGLSATITPQFAFSKILVLVSQSWRVRNDGGSGAVSYARILRSGTVIADEFYNYSYDYGSSGTIQQVPAFLQTLDSPNTTNNIEYKTQGKLHAGTDIDFQLSNSRSVITLMEIAG